MKKIFLLISLLFVAVTVNAEMQQGYTKTRGKLDAKGQLIPGQRLSGVIVETDRGKVTSEKDGAFSLAIPNGKFVLKKVDLNGYILNDFEQLRTYSCSTTPIALVLIHPDEYTSEKVYAQKKIIRTLRRTLQEREDEIDSLFEQQKISEQEKNELYQKLYADEQNSQKLVEEMAERYAKTDFDQIDEFQRQVANLIINGELEKADSLLNTKGNIEEQIRENQQLDEANRREREELTQREDNLTKSEAFSTKTKEGLAARCYSKYEIYATKHKNDSAAYYLELRASIDTTNVEWNLRAGKYILEYKAEYKKAMSLFERGLRNCNDKDLESTCYNLIGYVYHVLHNFNTALEYYEKSLDIRLNLYGEQHASVATIYNNIGGVYEILKDYSKALEYYEKALSIKISILGDNSVDVATSYNNIGGIYDSLNNFEKALEYYNKSLEIRILFYGENHKDVAKVYNNIGAAFHKQNNFEKALEYYEKAFGIDIIIFGEKHPNVATLYGNILTANYKLCRYDEALEYAQKFFNVNLSLYGEIHPKVQVSYHLLCLCYTKLGDTEKAEECRLKAEEIKAALEKK